MPKTIADDHAARLRAGHNRFVAQKRDIRGKSLIRIAPYRIFRFDERNIVLAKDGGTEDDYLYYPELRYAIEAAFDKRLEAKMRASDAASLGSLLDAVQSARLDLITAIASAKTN